MVQIGADSIFEGSMKRASKRKCLLALNLSNEAEGTRTLNLRIDSPNFRFVTYCELSVYGGKKRTYGADWGATGVALGAD